MASRAAGSHAFLGPPCSRLPARACHRAAYAPLRNAANSGRPEAAGGETGPPLARRAPAAHVAGAADRGISIVAGALILAAGWRVRSQCISEKKRCRRVSTTFMRTRFGVGSWNTQQTGSGRARGSGRVGPMRHREWMIRSDSPDTAPEQWHTSTAVRSSAVPPRRVSPGQVVARSSAVSLVSSHYTHNGGAFGKNPLAVRGPIRSAGEVGGPNGLQTAGQQPDHPGLRDRERWIPCA